MRVSAVAAMALNRVIGRNNELPWNIPEEMAVFKEITQGGVVLMGRRTWDSMKGEPLPGRENWVVTKSAKSADFALLGARVFASASDAIEEARKSGCTELFVIGGAELWKSCWPEVNRIYLSVIQREYEGDTYFPKFDEREFSEVSRRTYQASVPFECMILDRV